MPELPDITAYLTALMPRVVGEPLEQIRVVSPLLLRTAVPPIRSVEGKVITELRRLGKRLVFVLKDEGDEPLFLVLHLMIAGRLHWRERGAKLAGRNALAAFDFPNGSLVLTEAGAKRRASLHLVCGEAILAELDPGGADVLALSPQQFREVLSAENHTLKRALTDPRVLSGIGNAYSDEILWAAKLSPLTQTHKLTKDELERLYRATTETLQLWTDRLNAEAAKKFPENVTAFRPDMAVHGRYGLACPRCGAPVQRIRYANNETNYCPTCQTDGRVLADRSLSILLGSDWPRTLEELEAMKRK